MTVNDFVDELSSISLPNVFNPYRDICESSDHIASSSLRRQNLTLFLNALVRQHVRSLWLGRDLGYRGGRRTGIPLTDECHLNALQNTFGVFGIVKATTNQEEPVRERTASEVWKILRIVGQPILLWNVFPFHPFEDGKSLSNRRHSSQEFDLCRDILTAIFEWIEPTIIVALGADAEAALLSLGYQCQRVRHPSHGGQHAFATQILDVYHRSSANERHTTLLPLPV